MAMSTLYQLADAKLGGGLYRELWILRSDGYSYRAIAEIVTDRTGVAVSKSTIHLWMHADVTASN